MSESHSPGYRRKSVIGSLNPTPAKASTANYDSSVPTTPESLALNKRRSSSFASTSSPWFRRNSFLSPSMIQNENFSVYDSPSFYSESASYNIISLKECQGFIFNQDLFASPYQQSRSLANERKTRALSVSKSKSRSRSNSRSHPKPTVASPRGCTPPTSTQRRHTSYHFPRPVFVSSTSNLDNAVIDDDEMENSNEKDGDSEIPSDEEVEEEDEDEEDADDAIVNEYDEYDDYEEMSGYGGDSNNRRYKVHVTEIVINDDDADIFPS